MKILLINDQAEDTDFIRNNLLKIPECRFEITRMADPEVLVRLVDEGSPPNLIVLNYDRRGQEGVELLGKLNQMMPCPPPVLVIAGEGDPRTAVEFMKHGALDYLLKDDINTEVLNSSIFSALERSRLQGRLAEANRTIQEMAFTDGLTGLFNRHFFNESLNREYENALRYNYPLACIMVDLDFFKALNDRFGHLTGDEALRQIAETVRAMVRSGDVAARYGGDEVVILLPHTPMDGAMIVAQRIQAELRTNPITGIQTEEIYLTASFGISCLAPGSFYSKEDLINQADAALYHAKQGGKNRIMRWVDDSEGSALEAPSDYSNMLEYYKRSLQRLQLQVKDSYIELCETLVKAIESRDPLVVDFSKKVMGLAVSTGMELGLSSEEVEIIKNAAMLHDIGMIGIPDKVLLKKEPLTEEEIRSIQRHPAIGMEMLMPVSFLDRERQIILQHHEWFNGRGYPSGIRGERIPIGARIIAVADSYVAMCEDRTHRKGMESQKALGHIIHNKGRRYDPAVVEAFIVALGRVRQDDPLSSFQDSPQDCSPVRRD